MPPATLERLVDHAALFPPASMGIEEALAEDRRARSSAEAWMLGRFVAPASKLAALQEAAGGGLPALSVVLDGDDLGAALERAAAAPGVEAVEVLAPDPSGLRERVDAALGPQVEVYVEGADPRTLSEGLRGKVRCGGATREAYPSVEELAAYVEGAAAAGTVFKATAGLHHPVRTGHVHGFLNLLAACEAARRGGDVIAALAEEHGDAVVAALPGPEVRELFAGFGSCSFAEPVEDLKRLGVL